MKQQFQQWLDFDSSNHMKRYSNGISSPIRQDNNSRQIYNQRQNNYSRQNHNSWQSLLKPQQKQVLQQSIQIFPTVKRKYQQKFNTNIPSSSSSSPFQDDQISNSSHTNIRSQHQAIVKSQKQHIKRIQQENRFLKQKIDDLSFRLRQTQIEINKLKYSGNNNITNFQSMKQACLKQISDLMSKSQGHAPQTCQAFKKLRQMTAFDGKMKVDLLNYFMSQLLQNIVNDSTFYYIDSILNKKGPWKQSVNISSSNLSNLTSSSSIASSNIKSSNITTQHIRKVDQQIIQIMQLQQQKQLNRFKTDLQQALIFSAGRYKTLWKTFYKSYINLLNQGFVVQNFLRNATGRIISYIDKQNFGKLELHFQKIRLRKDIRSLRQSWFRQIQYQQQNQGQSNQFQKDKINGNKKSKINSNNQ